MGRVILLAVVLTLTVACSKTTYQEATIANVCTDKFMPKQGESGDIEPVPVVLTGYPALEQGLFIMVSDTMTVKLFEGADRKGKSVDVSIKIGTEDNRIKGLPEKFKESDLAITTDNGKTAGFNQKITIKAGRLTDIVDRKACWLTLDKVTLAK